MHNYILRNFLSYLFTEFLFFYNRHNSCIYFNPHEKSFMIILITMFPLFMKGKWLFPFIWFLLGIYDVLSNTSVLFMVNLKYFPLYVFSNASIFSLIIKNNSHICNYHYSAIDGFLRKLCWKTKDFMLSFRNYTMT